MKQDAVCLCIELTPPVPHLACVLCVSPYGKDLAHGGHSAEGISTNTIGRFPLPVVSVIHCQLLESLAVERYDEDFDKRLQTKGRGNGH